MKYKNTTIRETRTIETESILVMSLSSPWADRDRLWNLPLYIAVLPKIRRLYTSISHDDSWLGFSRVESSEKSIFHLHTVYVVRRGWDVFW